MEYFAREKHSFMDIMKHRKLINFNALSEELTRSKTKVKPVGTANKYRDSLEELDLLIDAWLKWNKQRLK